MERDIDSADVLADDFTLDVDVLDDDSVEAVMKDAVEDVVEDDVEGWGLVLEIDSFLRFSLRPGTTLCDVLSF